MGNLPPRVRGSGSITEAGNGFRAFIRLPDATGTVVRHTRRFDSYEDADEWLSGLRLQQQGGGGGARKAQAAEIQTVADLLRIWLKAKYRQNRLEGKPDIETIREYDMICRVFIVPELGGKVIAYLDDADIEEWQDFVAGYISEKTKNPLSPERKRKIWLVLRQAFKYGDEKRLIKHDPTMGVKGFTATTSNPLEKAMEDRDYRLFLSFIEKKGCQHYAGYCQLRWEMALFLGRRQGEVLGLSWSYVDLQREFIQIENRLKRRSWQHGCGKLTEDGWPCGKKQGQYCPDRKDGGLNILKGTKGGISNKPQIPIGDMIPLFKAHKNAQDRERAKARRDGTYSPLDPAHGSLVFTQPTTQRAYGARHDTDLFEKILKEAGITSHYSVHGLRHTAASRLSNSTGGDLPVIREILGHKSINTTMLYISTDLKARQSALSKTRQDASKTKKRKKPRNFEEESA